MKTTCIYCDELHRIGEKCPHKPHKIKKNTLANRFRQTYVWREKAKAMKRRDKYLCQYCLHTKGIPNTKDLEVHHIEGLAQNYARRLDDKNLITLCRYCHEDADNGKIDPAVLFELVSPGDSCQLQRF